MGDLRASRRVVQRPFDQLGEGLGRLRATSQLSGHTSVDLDRGDRGHVLQHRQVGGDEVVSSNRDQGHVGALTKRENNGGDLVRRDATEGRQGRRTLCKLLTNFAEHALGDHGLVRQEGPAGHQVKDREVALDLVRHLGDEAISGRLFGRVSPDEVVDPQQRVQPATDVVGVALRDGPGHS